jgi:hypothetical protein
MPMVHGGHGELSHRPEGATTRLLAKIAAGRLTAAACPESVTVIPNVSTQIKLQRNNRGRLEVEEVHKRTSLRIERSNIAPPRITSKTAKARLSG